MRRYSCPLCKDDLSHTKQSGKFIFTCSSCGFSKSGMPGYTLTESYKWITRKKSKKSGKGAGFQTNRKNKLTLQKKLLEDDPKILANTNKVKSLDKKDLPEPLKNILTVSGHLPIYYKKLPRTPPPLGGPIENIVKLTGLRKRLKEKNIERLYKYQEEAYKHIMNGENIVITAPTGLGKTEGFLLPLIYSMVLVEANPRKRISPSALLIYPTKALAADQRKKVAFYCSGLGIRVEVYDGDTPQNTRNLIFNSPPDILITNADMIHYHLSGNLRFQALMMNIRYLVLDEIHLAVGTFGTNILWIIRRLRRFSPGMQCIGASATISNAKNFAETIFDRPVKLISTGTARKSDINLSMLYPKSVSNISTILTAANQFIENGNKTLIFGNGHKSAEVINMILKQRNVRSQIHRAGLPLHHRNKVETMFKNDELDVLVSTPTLELGIDIGNLDSVISQLTNLTSFVQRIGRAGRQGQESYATLVLNGDDPISAYYARNPQDYLSDLLPAYVEPNNSLIAKFQILAMSLDKPLIDSEIIRYANHVEDLVNARYLRRNPNGVEVIDKKRAYEYLRSFSIRGMSNEVTILHQNKEIGTRALPLALKELHEGAIYLHGGNSYKVKHYRDKINTAEVLKLPSSSEKTQAIRVMEPKIISIEHQKDVDGLAVAYLNLQLKEFVTGYIKQDIFTNKIKGKYELDIPLSYTYDTKGFALSVPHPEEFVSNLDGKNKEIALGGTFHAIEHVLIESGNSLTGGGANQIGGLSIGDTGLMFVYDGTEGGSGLSKLLYDSLSKGLTRSLKIMQDCPCKRNDGCPRCTYSYQCGNNNMPLNRIGAIESLTQFGKTNTEMEDSINDIIEGKETYIANPDFS